MRPNLFWKFALTFLALQLSVLLAVDLFAERALRRNYERTGFDKLAAIARVANARPLVVPASSSPTPAELGALDEWTAQMAVSGARVTVIAADGRVLADSESDSLKTENQAAQPEVLAAMGSGEGRSRRHSAAIQRDLLFYAVRQSSATGQPPVTVRFALPLEAVDEILGSFRRRLWLTSLTILFVAGGASLLVSRRFTGRVERLKEFSKRVAEGDFRPMPVESSGDSLQALCTSLNQTAARLDRTIRTLTEERNLSSAILGSMVEGVAVVNGAERLVFANPGFAETDAANKTASDNPAVVSVPGRQFIAVHLQC